MRFAPWMLAAAGLPLLTLACSSNESLSPATFPLAVGGGFTVTIPPDERLVIASADGRVLLDGLAPAPVADGAPPLTGFAVRDETTAYEMQYGAFMPDVTTKGPWRTAERLATRADGTIELRDGRGAVLATVSLGAPEEGHLVASIAPGPGPERHFTWGFACDAGDHFAGFGAQSLDVDHLGFTVPTWVEEQGIGKSMDDSYGGVWFLQGTRHASQVPIPQYLSRRGYILTTGTNLRSIFALCSESPMAARVEVDLPAVVHVFDGPTPAEAIGRATATFGRPRVPPKVAFAPWLDAIMGDANVRAVAQKLRKAGIPTSVLWTEDWRGGDLNPTTNAYALAEEWEVDTTLYPDMKGMTDELHAEGFDFFVYFNPFVYKGSKAWSETAPNGWLVKHIDGTPYTFPGAKLPRDTGLIDLDNPSARAWAVQKMQDAIALGADGWMNDFGEWLPTDGMTAAGPSLGRHNLYPVLWQETARAAIDGVTDGVERLFFSRSGWLGTAPLVDVMWAGDQRTDFEPDDGLPTVLPIGIGMGIVGVSTYGHDIAGYQSATNPPSTKELFFRWTELGAWTPVMRTHHGTEPSLEWSWQSDAETTAHFARYAKQHMALVPYLRGLAETASQTGMPMWRGLMLAYPDDVTAWGVKDEVLLGDGVLVAPVMTMGATDRPVYLPAGRWYPWAGGAAITGATTVTAAAPVSEIPVYAAAGTVVPTYPDGVMTLVRGSAAVPDATSVGDDRIVYAFLGAAGEFLEPGGLAYTLLRHADATGSLSAAWNGQALAACSSPPAAPCVETTADGIVARVTGSGSLDVTGDGGLAATLRALGGIHGPNDHLGGPEVAPTQPPSFPVPLSAGPPPPGSFGAPVPAPAQRPQAAQPAAVRLPLQIGTSCLWSLARGAGTLLPGIALVIGALPLMTVGSIYATAFAGVVGGLLVYFAGMHLLLAARERASDVLIDGGGLRVEGGVHHGRAVPWSSVDSARTTLTQEKERRFTLARILGNGFVILLILLVRRRVPFIPRKEIDVARLRVGLRDGSVMLLAEAERPIEKESLEALHEAICSSGWHAPPGAPKPKRPGGRHTTMGLTVLLCNRCGAVAIPDDKEAVACRFCGNPVPVPPATRERIAASLRVREGRRTSDRVVGKLLQQPGAGPIGTKLVIAAVVMLLAWPVSFVVAGIEIATRLHEPLGLLSLFVFPVAMISGLFFLMRASLSDRFALRLLTLDFGAQHPHKEGDPYTCRRCDAPLPDEPGTVVVGCRYCGADNILGLDLRRYAAKATREATSLEDALKKRAEERRLWGSLTAVAVLLMLVGVAALGHGVSSMIDLDALDMGTPAAKPAQRPAKGTAKPAAKGAPAATQRPAPRR